MTATWRRSDSSSSKRPHAGWISNLLCGPMPTSGPTARAPSIASKDSRRRPTLPYCRDALALLLKTCPGIQGLTMRVHGESGIPEGSYDFWRTVFQGIVRAGRPIEIDMHAKGIDQKMIDVAIGDRHAGQNLAEILGRASGNGLSPGSHPGIGNAARWTNEWKGFSVSPTVRGVFSVMAMGTFSSRGTAMVCSSACGPARSACCSGATRPPPRRMAMRRISAEHPAWNSASLSSSKDVKAPAGPGGRCGYADASLNPTGGDWRKYEYSYRVWGRLLYNPNADPDQWRRYLRSTFERPPHRPKRLSPMPAACCLC